MERRSRGRFGRCGSDSGSVRVDVARRAGLSRHKISRLERGLLAGFKLTDIERAFEALGARVTVQVLWRGAGLDRLLDEGHVALVCATAQLFRVFGWVVEIEVSFARFGERGSIDILAWHGQEQALLVVEVKTELASVEGLLRTIDVKVRLAPEVAHQRFGWQPRVVGRLVVLPEDRTARRRVARHAGVLDVALPTRSREVRNWLKMPQQPMAGLWFLTHAHGSHYAKSVSGPARAQPFLTSNACLSDVPRGDARTFRSA